MRRRNVLWSLAFAVLTLAPQGMWAQQKASISPTSRQVSYAARQTVTIDQENERSPLLDMMKNHRRQLKSKQQAPLFKESRPVLGNLLQRHAPIQITAEKLRRAAKAPAKAPYVPDNNHKHLIVNVIYNSTDETLDEGLFDLDVVTGELTLLSGGFIEDYENYGFNGGGYVWNGKYRGVFYDDEYNYVSNSNQATIMEFDMSTWELTDIFDVPYMSSMALECATQFNADGTTTVMGQYWGVDREGKLSLRYATLDADGILTTTFGQSATKHMMAMGVTNDGRLYGVAKDGNLYRVDRTTGEEILVGHTGIEDIVDYEGEFWIQSGEIDPRDNTFYWMADHASVFWTQLCTVDLQTGKATPLIDFSGDVQSVGMVIAPQQRQDATPDMVSNLKVSFAPLQTTGSGSFTAPATTFGGQQLPAGTTLYYHLYVNDVEQTLADHQAAPGADVSFVIPSTNVKSNADNTFRVTIANAKDGEESVSVTTHAWAGYDVPEAPKNVAMTFDEASRTATITWEAPAKGDFAGIHGCSVDNVCYYVYRLVDGERTGVVPGGAALADDVRSISYTLTQEDMTMTLADLSFAVEAWTAPWAVPQESLASEAAATNAIRMGKGKETPYFVDIANNYYKVNQKDFTIINGNNDRNAWEWCPPHYTGGQDLCGAVACANYSGTMRMDDWFITPGIALKAGTIYHYKSYVHGPGATVPWAEFAEVWMGSDRTAEAMTSLLIERTMVVGYMYLEADFTVPEDGNYYFGIHSVSDPDQWEIALFDIYVGENIGDPVDYQAPAEGQIAVAPIYGADKMTDASGNVVYVGAADIQVTLPTEKLDGTALTDSDLLDVTVTASDGTTTFTLGEYAAQAKGAVLPLKAENLPSGAYTFTLQTSLASHLSPVATQSAYVGWDNAVAVPTDMTTTTSGNKLYVVFPEQSQPRGANGGYLPQLTYRAYGGSKASQLSYYADQGYDYVYDMVDADGVSINNRITVPDLDPQEGLQYLWRWYVLAVSKNASGKNIYSQLIPIRAVVGEPVKGPVIETGEYEFIIDAEVSYDLAEKWNYYLNRGQVVCGVSPIEDQFGYDVGKSWNIFSAFNGDLSTYFGKVDVSTLIKPVLAFDIIMEDSNVGMDIVLNGPDGKQAIVPLTVMDGIQHIAIPLDEYRTWGYVQPTMKANFHIEQEGDRIHDIYIDNVGVYDQMVCNLAINAVEADAEMKAGQESIVNVTVMNLGQQPVRNYTVTLLEDEVNIMSETFTRALQPGEINVVQFHYQPNTVTDFDVVGQEEAEKVLAAVVDAHGDLNEDDNMAEAVVTIAVSGGKKNTHPDQVVAQQADDKATVNVTWAFDFDQSSQVITESFEDYELWSTGGVKSGAPEGQIGLWKVYDADNKPTYTWEYFDMISETAGEPQAFQVFDGQIFLSTEHYYYYNLDAVTGNQYLVSMDPADGNYVPVPDDYLISPIVPGGSVVEFYYGSVLGRLQGLEVLYSETGQDISDFKLLQKLDDTTSTEWSLAYITLPKTAKYFAIHHNKASHLGYGLKIDDITYNSLTSVDHFNIYVDGRLVGTSQTASYAIAEPLDTGKHRIAVTAVFADGTESIPAYASLNYESAISDVLLSGRPFDVYSIDGKLVRSQTRSLYGLHGVYVVEGKNVILK
ncbi:MAG: choice-of-anchor J domain-containing protein [Prevotella sp.]|nr:choice-of-anchor J domain-containing protein [Prevotella sp.]